MEENKTTFKKINLKDFIETLVEVYNSGADFIDLIGKPDDYQDTIAIVVHEEYLADEDELEFDEEELKDVKLSDDDLNELL